ncbi:MAG: serine hydrolase [Azospirillaceae bacterium]|nr:serine hydrolase [Azospirillaceae bacterium]
MLDALPVDTVQRLAGVIQEVGSPGVALTVTSHGRTAFHGWGWASLPFSVPVTAQTFFNLGPASRHVTALCVLRLAEDGLVDRGQSIGHYLPDLPPAWADAPIQSLLTHTSGLPDYLDILPDPFHPPRRDAFQRITSPPPPRFSAGEAWAPSNTDDLLLGWLVETVAKQPFAAFLANRIFPQAYVPTGQTDAGEQIIERRAEPYERSRDSLGPTYIHAPLSYGGAPYAGTGGILFDADDIARWDGGWKQGRIAAVDLAPMLAPTPLATGRSIPYGLGWHLGQTRGRVYHLRAGSIPGYSAATLRLPADDIAVTVCANVGGADAALRRMAWVVAELSAPGGTPLTLAPIAADPVDKRLAAILDMSEAPRLDTKIFAPEMMAGLSDPTARRDVLPAFKPPVTLTPIEEYSVQQGRMRRYRAVAPNGMDSLLAGFDKDDRLYWLQPH